MYTGMDINIFSDLFSQASDDRFSPVPNENPPVHIFWPPLIAKIYCSLTVFRQEDFID